MSNNTAAVVIFIVFGIVLFAMFWFGGPRETEAPLPKQDDDIWRWYVEYKVPNPKEGEDNE